MLATRKPLEAPAKLDVYVGMLTVSLGALAVACLLLFIDYSNYPTARPVEPAAPEVAKPKPASTPTTSEKG